MVANCDEDCSLAFMRFLRFLGTRVHLKGWKAYNGGLDTKDNTDGETSIYCQWKDCQAMFIVPSLMHFDAYDPQQSRRRYAVEEAVVVIVFQEEGASLSPMNAASQYNRTHSLCLQPLLTALLCAAIMPFSDQPQMYSFRSKRNKRTRKALCESTGMDPAYLWSASVSLTSVTG